MNWTTELPLVLDGVDGDLKIVYNPMGQKFYQNGQEIRRSGSGFGGQKYKVKTSDGGEEIINVKASVKNGRQIVYRGETISLEEPVSGLTIVLSLLPFLFIALVVVVFAGGRFGIIDAALLGGCGALGMMTICNVLRGERDFVKQVTTSIIISVIVTAVFFVLALILGLIFGAILGAAFTFM